MDLNIEYCCKPRTLFPFNSKKLTVSINLLSGYDGDCMVGPWAHFPINQTPLAGAWLELQDLIVVLVVREAIPSS